jgi:hypothetical protein
VQAALAEVDRQIEVLLMARESVEQQNGGALDIPGGAVQAADQPMAA